MRELHKVSKGKGFIEDIKSKESEAIEKAQEEIEKPKEQEKSARERLKDKGLL